jgi:alanine dehydrogenase
MIALDNMIVDGKNLEGQGLTNATLYHALKLANLGYKRAMKEDSHLMMGLNAYFGQVTNAYVAEDLSSTSYMCHSIIHMTDSFHSAIPRPLRLCEF